MTLSAAEPHSPSSPWDDAPWLGLIIHALPLLGVMFLGWSLFSVMLIYWMEAGLMIVTGVARVCWCGPRPVRNTVTMLLLSPIYFGPALGFVFAFFMGVVTFFYGPEPIVHAEDMPSMGEVGSQILAEWLWVPVLLIAGNYVLDFFQDWVRSGAYRNGDMVKEMFKVYGTMMLMMIVLIITGAVLLETGLGSLAVAFVVLVRIALDIAIHLITRVLRNQHQGQTASPGPQA